MRFESTPTLKIAYEEGGPSDGLPVILLHGWPDDVRTYDRVVPDLHAAGFRTVAPSEIPAAKWIDYDSERMQRVVVLRLEL